MSLGSMCTNLFNSGRMAIDIGCTQFKKAPVKSTACIVLGAAAVAASAVGVATLVKGNEQQPGDNWMGHFFPYSQFPHGHMDCPHGASPEACLSDDNKWDFLARRSDNERGRERGFYELSGGCIPGIHEMCKKVAEVMVCCSPLGKISKN